MKKALSMGLKPLAAPALGRRLMATLVICGVALGVFPAGSAEAALVPTSRVRIQQVKFDPQMAIETANAAPINTSGTASAPRVMVDMKVMAGEVPAILELETNRTLVPVRFVAEGLGASVSWDPYFQRVLVQTKNRTIVLTVGVNLATVNGEEVALDQAPYIRYDRVYVPLRFVAEVLGAQVDWVGAEAPYWASGWLGKYQVWIWHQDGFWGAKGMRERLDAHNWFLRG